MRTWGRQRGRAKAAAAAAATAVLAVLAVLAVGVAATAAQQEEIPPPGTSSDNLIDLLSRSQQHSVFLRLLQRARLIPTLNNLMQFGDRGISLLAPTNAAFLNSSDRVFWMRCAHLDGSEEKQLLSDDDEEDDGKPGAWSNNDELLRQRLLYHVLNFTLPYTNTSAASLPFQPVLHQTLHFPSRHLFDPTKPNKPTRPGPIPHPPAPPFMPGYDPDALLGSQGQVLRISAINVSTTAQSVLVFGADQRGRGGVVATAEDRTTKAGVLITINGVLSLPPKLEDVIHSHRSLSALSALFPPDSLRFLSLTPHLTLFAAASPAWKANLSTIEHSYLFDQRWQQAQGDRLKVLGWHSVSQGVDGKAKEAVIYADDLKRNKTSTLLTILGGRIKVTADPKSGLLSIGASKVIEEDVIIENGVIHIVSDLLLPYPDIGLGLNVEKTLLGMNASKFVDLMRSSDLEEYLTHPVGPLSTDVAAAAGPADDVPSYTFVVPRDDLVDDPAMAHAARLPSDTKKLRDVMLYHITPGAQYPQNLSDGMLVPTELRNWRLKGGRQRVVVSVGEEDVALRKGNGDVSFGGINVISDPVKVGPSLIYLTPSFLTPPSNPIQTAVSSLELSTFVAAVFSAHLDHGLKRAPGVSYLIPSNAAFENLGLVMPYLLSGAKADQSAAWTAATKSNWFAGGSDDEVPTPRDELRSVVEFHAIDSIVYLQDFPRPDPDAPTNGSSMPARSGSSLGSMIAWRRYPTLLEGAHIWAGRDTNGTVRIRRTNPFPDTDEGEAEAPTPTPTPSRVQAQADVPLLDADDRNDAVLKKADMLTSTGVIHEISRVELPETLDITIGKLMLGAKADTMLELVRKAGYGWILNGSMPTLAELEEADERDAFEAASDPADANRHHRRHKRDRERRRRHKRRHDMFRNEDQAYVLLAPSDAAFAKVNLTRYIADRSALKRLVQLHIVPLSAAAVEGVARMSEARYGGKMWPLALEDRLGMPTLLDRELGGASAYGRVAFRRLGAGGVGASASLGEGGGGGGGGNGGAGGGGGGGGDREDTHLGWAVGIRDSRGSVDGRRHVARVIGFGRENLGLVRMGRRRAAAVARAAEAAATAEASSWSSTPHPRQQQAIFKAESQVDLPPPETTKPSHRVAGGVLTLDAVLEEYHPGWWYVWGWIVALVLLMGGLLGLVGLALWRWMGAREGKVRLPDALEGEED